MSVNLLDLAKGAIGQQVMGQLGGILGQNEKQTSTAVNAALPAILGGLMQKGSTQSGAQDLMKELDNHDGGILDNLGGLLSGGGHSKIVEMGTSLLPMIFGQRQSGLIGTIGKLAGLGTGGATSLLGMLAPVVMGLIGKQRKATGMDVGGLMSMLSDQKDHVAKAMPAEISSELGLGSLLGSVGQAGSKAAGHVADAGRAAGQTASRAANAVPTKSGGGLGALIPLIGLGLLGLLAWMFWPKGAVDGLKDGAASVTGAVGDTVGGAADAVGGAVGGAADAVGGAVGGAADAVSGGVGSLSEGVSGAVGSVTGGLEMPAIPGLGDTTTKLTESLGGLTESISGIKDVDSAKAVAGELTDFSTTFDGMNLGALPAQAQTAVGGMLGPIVTKIQGALETAYAIPGVKGVLEPIVTPLLEKLSGIGA